MGKKSYIIVKTKRIGSTYSHETKSSEYPDLTVVDLFNIGNTRETIQTIQNYNESCLRAQRKENVLITKISLETMIK